MEKSKNKNVMPRIRVEMRDASDLNKEGKTALRFLIRITGEGKINRSTGIYIEPKNWSKRMERALGKSLETQRINKLLSEIIFCISFFEIFNSSTFVIDFTFDVLN